MSDRLTLVELFGAIMGIAGNPSETLAFVARLREADQELLDRADTEQSLVVELDALREKYARLAGAAQDVLGDIGPCDFRGRWCLTHQTNECAEGS